MKKILGKEILFLFVLIIAFAGCSRHPKDIGGFISLQPPRPHISLSCPNRPVINATLHPIGSLSSARFAMLTAAAGSKILFIGGEDAYITWWNEPVPVDIYDLADNTWSVHFLVPTNPQFSHFRFGAAAASLGNKIFIAGGGDVIGDNQTDQVDIYDASSGTWSMAHLSVPRMGLTAATAGNKILFAGGFGYPDGMSWGYFNTVDIYDNTNNSWSTTFLSQARMETSSATSGNKVYFAGGFNDNAVSGTIDIYDASENTWSVSSLLQPRMKMAGIAAGGKIFWAGGSNSSSSLHNNVEILDENSGISSSECFAPRSGLNGVRKNEHVVFFTGNDGGDGYQFEIYDTVSGLWSTGILNQKVEDAAIISVNNVIYVGGGRIDGSLSNKLWKLEF